MSPMMMPAVSMVVIVAVAAVCTAFGLEGDLYLHEIRSETAEHILDHMVGANAEERRPEFPSANAGFPDAKQAV